MTSRSFTTRAVGIRSRRIAAALVVGGTFAVAPLAGQEKVDTATIARIRTEAMDHSRDP